MLQPPPTREMALLVITLPAEIRLVVAGWLYLPTCICVDPALIRAMATSFMGSTVISASAM